MKKPLWFQSLRWVILILLLSWGAYQAFSMREELGNLQGPLSALPIMIISVVFTQWVQGRMSQQLIRFSDRDISLLKAFQLNIISGLWGTLLPLGSVGFKANFFKKELDLSLQTYAANYGLALLATLFIGSGLAGISFLILGKPLWALCALCSGVLLLALLSWAPGVLQWASNKVGHPDWFSLDSSTLRHRLFTLSRIQAMGLFGYTGIYFGCFLLVGHHLSPLLILIMVVAQSWMFLAPLVPGNLVLLEGLGAWWMLKNGVPVPDSITAIALMRLSFLIVLILLAPWSQSQLGKPTKTQAKA
jgi:hypothetical protein